MTTEGKPENISTSAFKTLFDIATDGIFIEDSTGTIIDCNLAGEKMFGYEPGELKNVHISKLVPPDFAKFIPKVITDEHVTGDQYLERVNMKKDGTVFPTEICTKYTYINGEKRLIAFIHDISKRKKMENELHDAKKELEKALATRDTFFSILSHDLKSPMQSILGFTELLDEAIDDSQEDLKHYVEQLKFSANTSYTLIDNLLHWALSQTKRIVAHTDEFILGSVCASHIKLLQDIAGKKDITISKTFPENLKIRTDKNMLLFIVRNLITNAIKFTENGGNVDITVLKTGNNVKFIIKDNGIGMTSEMLNKITNKHTIHSTNGTNSEKGTGLGLKVCTQFLELLGSELIIVSTPGKGSAFSFEIPVVVN